MLCCRYLCVAIVKTRRIRQRIRRTMQIEAMLNPIRDYVLLSIRVHPRENAAFHHFSSRQIGMSPRLHSGTFDQATRHPLHRLQPRNCGATRAASDGLFLLGRVKKGVGLCALLGPWCGSCLSAVRVRIRSVQSRRARRYCQHQVPGVGAYAKQIGRTTTCRLSATFLPSALPCRSRTGVWCRGTAPRPAHRSACRSSASSRCPTCNDPARTHR